LSFDRLVFLGITALHCSKIKIARYVCFWKKTSRPTKSLNTYSVFVQEILDLNVINFYCYLLYK